MEEPNKKVADELKKLCPAVTKKFDKTHSNVDNRNDIELYDKIKLQVFNHWIGDAKKEKKLNPYFAAFACRGCGSQVAVWLLPDRTIENAPVVLISSEGDLSVLANDYFSFLNVISMGYDMFQLRDSDLGSPWYDENPEFKTWLSKTYKVKPVKDLEKELAAVRKANPDFEKFVADF